MGFHFGKQTKYRACEEHWITPKHYAHCIVHIARRIWETIEGDKVKWMGTVGEWRSIDVTGSYAPLCVSQFLYDNARAVSTALDVVDRYAKQERIHRRVGEQLRQIHHRYRWIDAKPPGHFPIEVREAFYAILDARETRAAYSYMRQFNVDHAERALLIAALDELRR